MLAATWPGPNSPEARAAYERARESGLSAARSLVVGCIASFREGWLFRKTLAEHTGLSVRTVQRAITQAKGCGLIGVARAKQHEIPPGLSAPLACGWSHRWVIGWGQAVEAARAAVANCRLVRAAKAALRTTPSETAASTSTTTKTRVVQRRWTSDEIDEELEQLERAKAPRGIPPPVPG